MQRGANRRKGYRFYREETDEEDGKGEGGVLLLWWSVEDPSPSLTAYLVRSEDSATARGLENGPSEGPPVPAPALWTEVDVELGQLDDSSCTARLSLGSWTRWLVVVNGEPEITGDEPRLGRSGRPGGRG